jgi:cation transporter-like permease
MSITEITLAGGERLQVQGEAETIEAAILSAARGSLLEFAWMADARTGERIGVNPDHVVALRAVNAGSGDLG